MLDFDTKKGALNIRFGENADMISDNNLTNKFMKEIYRKTEEAKKVWEGIQKRDENPTIYKRFKDLTRYLAGKEEAYIIPITGIEFYPQSNISDTELSYLRSIAKNSLDNERVHYTFLRNRWEKISDFLVNISIALDVAAFIAGGYKWINTGDVEQGKSAFGFYAVIGTSLLVGSALLKRFREKPHKKKEDYSSHLAAKQLIIHKYKEKDQAKAKGDGQALSGDEIREPDQYTIDDMTYMPINPP